MTPAAGKYVRGLLHKIEALEREVAFFSEWRTRRMSHGPCICEGGRKAQTIANGWVKMSVWCAVCGGDRA